MGTDTGMDVSIASRTVDWTVSAGSVYELSGYTGPISEDLVRKLVADPAIQQIVFGIDGSMLVAVDGEMEQRAVVCDSGGKHVPVRFDSVTAQHSILKAVFGLRYPGRGKVYRHYNIENTAVSAGYVNGPEEYVYAVIRKFAIKTEFADRLYKESKQAELARRSK